MTAQEIFDLYSPALQKMGLSPHAELEDVVWGEGKRIEVLPGLFFLTISQEQYEVKPKPSCWRHSECWWDGGQRGAEISNGLALSLCRMAVIEWLLKKGYSISHNPPLRGVMGFCVSLNDWEESQAISDSSDLDRALVSAALVVAGVKK